jgi:lysophospholipase L1-like esterase
MSWDAFGRSVECNVILSKPPDIVFIYLGGNDLLTKSLRKLRFIIRADIS